MQLWSLLSNAPWLTERDKEKERDIKSRDRQERQLELTRNAARSISPDLTKSEFLQGNVDTNDMSGLRLTNMSYGLEPSANKSASSRVSGKLSSGMPSELGFSQPLQVVQGTEYKDAPRVDKAKDKDKYDAFNRSSISATSGSHRISGQLHTLTSSMGTQVGHWSVRSELPQWLQATVGGAINAHNQQIDVADALRAIKTKKKHSHMLNRWERAFIEGSISYERYRNESLVLIQQEYAVRSKFAIAHMAGEQYFSEEFLSHGTEMNEPQRGNEQGSEREGNELTEVGVDWLHPESGDGTTQAAELFPAHGSTSPEAGFRKGSTSLINSLISTASGVISYTASTASSAASSAVQVVSASATTMSRVAVNYSPKIHRKGSFSSTGSIFRLSSEANTSTSSQSGKGREDTVIATVGDSDDAGSTLGSSGKSVVQVDSEKVNEEKDHDVNADILTSESHQSAPVKSPPPPLNPFATNPFAQILESSASAVVKIPSSSRASIIEPMNDLAQDPRDASHELLQYPPQDASLDLAVSVLTPTPSLASIPRHTPLLSLGPTTPLSIEKSNFYSLSLHNNEECITYIAVLKKGKTGFGIELSNNILKAVREGVQVVSLSVDSIEKVLAGDRLLAIDGSDVGDMVTLQSSHDFFEPLITTHLKPLIYNHSLITTHL